MRAVACDDERVIRAAIAFADRLNAAVDVFEGEVFRLVMLSAFLDVFEAVEAESGESEARRAMCAAIALLTEHMATVRGARAEAV